MPLRTTFTREPIVLLIFRAMFRFVKAFLKMHYYVAWVILFVFTRFVGVDLFFSEELFCSMLATVVNEFSCITFEKIM